MSESFRDLRHLEVKLVALVAEVLARLMPHVAVRAVELILIVRREMRIGGLHVLRLRDKRLHIVAKGAGLRRGLLQILLVGTVADRALHSLGDVLVGKRGALSRKAGGRKSSCQSNQRVFHWTRFRIRLRSEKLGRTPPRLS